MIDHTGAKSSLALSTLKRLAEEKNWPSQDNEQNQKSNHHHSHHNHPKIQSTTFLLQKNLPKLQITILTAHPFSHEGFLASFDCMCCVQILNFLMLCSLFSLNPFPPLYPERQVSTMSTRKLSSWGSWTQSPISNCLMLGSDFLGSPRPLEFIQLYLYPYEMTFSIHPRVQPERSPEIIIPLCLRHACKQLLWKW